MIVSSIFIVFIYVNDCSCLTVSRHHSKTDYGPKAVLCGVDQLPNNTVHEELADIKSFPWLGLLIYPIDFPRPTTTAVVLITRQIALATALDIDYYPKNDFRARSRVVLGTNCSGPFIRVLDYTFHPDFTRSTFSTLALVQLDTMRLDVMPVCPPPAEFNSAEEIYAMNMVHDCYNNSMVKIYKMKYVDEAKCRNFYRTIGLAIQSMWPKHMACAQGVTGGHCIWRSGTALVIRDQGEWKLLGVGTYGPGCTSPSRFLDYGMYRLWVKRSIERIGRPTITRIGSDHVIIRRGTNTVQRYGRCDAEEMKHEIFTERTGFEPPDYLEYDQIAAVIYNVTLYENVDYHCIILRAWNQYEYGQTNQPTITVRRFCTNNEPFCAEFTMQTVFYYVELKFRYMCTFKVVAFGAEIKYVDAKRLLLYNETKKERRSSQSKPLNTVNTTADGKKSIHWKHYHGNRPGVLELKSV